MKIAVYITSYNQKAYLVEAIDSVLAQTLRPYQIIIVDDCSTDGSQEVIAGYMARYPDLIQPIYHTTNQGVAATRNDALRDVTCDYVTYLDGDDRFLPAKLEYEAQTLLDNPGHQIVFSNQLDISADGSRLPNSIWFKEGVAPPQGNVFLNVFAREFPAQRLFHNEMVLYSCLREVGFYDPVLITYEDWDLRIRLTKRYKVIYCPPLLAEHRLHTKGLSHSAAATLFASVSYVYHKNRHLLKDLPPRDQLEAEERILTMITNMARRVATRTSRKRQPVLYLKRLATAARYYVRLMAVRRVLMKYP